VPTSAPTLSRARAQIAAGSPEQALPLLRPLAPRNGEAASLLIDALVGSGWNAVHVYHWKTAAARAREALVLAGPQAPSRGAHWVLGESLFATKDFTGALDQFSKALAENPREPKLKRRVLRSRRALRRPDDAAGVAASDPEAASESAGDE